MMPFTYREYEHMLETMMKAGYQFRGYHQVAADEAVKGKICVIRHDIDLHLEWAIPMALMEQERGISSTFCFMVRSEAYNVFSRTGAEVIDQILNSEHWLGLHFDCAAYENGTTPQEFTTACKKEAMMLTQWFGEAVRLVSYHKPNALVLGGMPEISSPWPHAYMYRFMKEMTYKADSHGFWRYGHPLDSEAFQNGEPLNLSVHPLWWSDEYRSPLYSMTIAARERTKHLREYMLTNLVGN